MAAPPKCVFFSPTDIEVFDEFLFKKQANDQVALLGSLVTDDFDLYEADPFTFDMEPRMYLRPLHRWFFVNRLPMNQNSVKPNRKIRSNNGMWKPLGKAKTVKRGNIINLGTVQAFIYVNQDGFQAGWRQEEYVRIVDNNAFQTTVVVHLFFDATQDRRP